MRTLGLDVHEASKIIAAEWPCCVLLLRNEGIIGNVEKRFGRKGVTGQKDFHRYDIDRTAQYAIWNINVDSLDHWRFFFRTDIDATWVKMKWG